MNISKFIISVVDSWEEDVVKMVEKKHGKNDIMISFECQTLKSEQAAEDHIRQFIPKLVGQDAVGTCTQILQYQFYYEPYFYNWKKKNILTESLNAQLTWGQWASEDWILKQRSNQESDATIGNILNKTFFNPWLVNQGPLTQTYNRIFIFKVVFRSTTSLT